MGGKQVVERLNQGLCRAAGENTGGLPVMPPVRAHGAHEQVIDATEMLTVGIARQAMTQEAVQRQRVQQVLQVIAVFAHGRGESVVRISFRRPAKMIRFPVDKVIAPLMHENQVDETFEIPVQLTEGQWRLIDPMGAQEGIESVCIHLPGGEAEFHFHKTVLRANGGQREARWQGGFQYRRQQGGEHGCRVGLVFAVGWQRILLQDVLDEGGPGRVIAEVDLFKERMNCLARQCATRKMQDVVAWQGGGRCHGRERVVLR